MSDTDTTGRRRTEPSEPSQHVIFLGLDPDATEADVGSVLPQRASLTFLMSAQLNAYLTSMGATLENVTIIRDRVTGSIINDHISLEASSSNFGLDSCSPFRFIPWLRLCPIPGRRQRLKLCRPQLPIHFHATAGLPS